MSSPHFTHCGLPGVGLIPFGMHACHVYADREQLLAALVPYFAAGLAGNERCLWITAPPLPASEAVEALRAAYAGADEAIEADALRVVDLAEWRGSPAGLIVPEVADLWLQEEERALADGHNGLRVSRNISFPASGDWLTLLACEQAVTARLSGRRIVALCSYASSECDEGRIGEVAEAHHCAFERPGAEWRVALPGHPRTSKTTVTLRRRDP